MRGQQTEADRIAELRDDPQCRQFDAHRCLCASCGRWVHLSGRAHKIFNWRRHKKGCSPTKARGSITIIQSRSPSMTNYEIDELDDGMDEDHYSSSYSYSDEGHGIYQNDRPYSQHNPRLPSISTFSLSASSEALTPPLSSSASTTGSESTHSLSPYTPIQPNIPRHKYDPVLASRVQCESCSKHVDLAEWTAHKRLCRIVQRANNIPAQSGFHHSPPRVRTTDLSPSFSSLPPLSSLTSYSGSILQTPRGTPDRPPPAPHMIMSRSQPSDYRKLPAAPRSADTLQQRHTAPPRKIADLCHPPSSVPDYSGDRSTPSGNSRHRSVGDLHSYQRLRSPDLARRRLSPSPSPPPSHSYRAHSRGRSLSPPSPFASDSEE